MRPEGRGPLDPVRRAHRPHARQLPADELGALLVAQLGPARTLDLLLRARLLTGELDDAAAAVVATLLEHAPLTMWAAKQAVTRLRRSVLSDGDDVVTAAFGSQDLHEGVRALAAKRRPAWPGR